MDTTLERILSLLPKDKKGNIKRGAKTEFACKLGYKNGDIISLWENGTSKSYLKKLHIIAEECGVSVEWLKGETDDPSPKNLPLKNESAELVEYLQELATRSEMRMLFSVSKSATKEQIEAIVRMIEAMQNNNMGE